MRFQSDPCSLLTEIKLRVVTENLFFYSLAWTQRVYREELNFEDFIIKTNKQKIICFATKKKTKFGSSIQTLEVHYSPLGNMCHVKEEEYTFTATGPRQ